MDAVRFHVARDHCGIRAKLKSQVHGHGRMHPKMPGLIAARGHHAPAALTANNQWLSLQFRVAFTLDSYKKGVQIKVNDRSIHTSIISKYTKNCSIKISRGCRKKSPADFRRMGCGA